MATPLSPNPHNGLKVKGPDIYIPPLTGKLEQQRFTMLIGELTSISSRQRSAISGCTSPQRTLDPQSVRQTHPCPNQPHYGLHLAVAQCSPAM